jgi:hypothetical protein
MGESAQFLIRSQKKKSKVSQQGTRPLPLRYSRKRLKTKRGEAETCETCPFCSNMLAGLVEGNYLTKGGEESIESQEVTINKVSQQTKNLAKLANTRIYTYCEFI